MLYFTVTPSFEEGWAVHVYRDNSPDWVVASWGQTQYQAITRARGNFAPGDYLTRIMGRRARKVS